MGVAEPPYLVCNDIHYSIAAGWLNLSKHQSESVHDCPIENATVNGYYTGEGITININSPRALNAVVGHEVTHAMKGSQMFDALSSAAVSYAKANGSYNSRLAALWQIYKGKPGYETDFDTKLQE